MSSPRLTMSLVALGASVSLLAAAPARESGRQTSRPRTITELARDWTRPILSSQPRGGKQASADRMAAISALEEARHTGCATPLMLSLWQRAGRLNQAARLSLNAITFVPQEPGSASLASPDGAFTIHYTTNVSSRDFVDPYDGDLNGAPDGVERLAAELSDVLADFVHVLGWAPAPSDSGRPVEVFLVGFTDDAAAPIAGFALPVSAPAVMRAPSAPPAEGADSILYLDARLAGHEAASRAPLAHQVAHLVLTRESAREAVWWHEASATWLENRLSGDAAVTAAALDESLLQPALGLAADRLALGREAFLWPHYLSLSTLTDAALLRDIWQEMAAVPGDNTMDAMDHVLRDQMGTSLAEELSVFNVWNLFAGQADDGQHYPFGDHLPTPAGDAVYDQFPARGGAVGGAVAPSGSALIRLLGDGSSGGLRLEFAGADPGVWNVGLVVYSATEPGRLRMVPVEVDESGRAQISIPWRSLAVMDLLVQNLAPAGQQPAEYSYAVDYDRNIPFELMGLSVDETEAGALVTWSTERETSLAGWNVYRGPSPLGPFTRITPYLVPGAGDAGHPASYLFVDSSAEPGRRHYYQLEGMTVDGFAETTHPAGVRLTPRLLPPAENR